MEDKEGSLYQWHINDFPTDYEEAQEKWEALAKTIQMLEILYQIPKDKIEKVLELALKH